MLLSRSLPLLALSNVVLLLLHVVSIVLLPRYVHAYFSASARLALHVVCY